MAACLSPVHRFQTIMSPLLVMVLGNLPVCLTAQAAVFLASPADLKFDSVDYKNVLHWTPPSSDHTLRFYVQWKIYGERLWLDVPGCQGIHGNHCDLSGVTSDPREWYYARAQASTHASRSAWTLSPRFNPRWDTKISPPVLRLNVTERGIVVRVRPPRPLVLKNHKRLCHKIYLMQANGEEDAYEMACCSKQLALDALSPGTRYCLQAQTLMLPQAKSSGRSAPKCVTMPHPKPTQQ